MSARLQIQKHKDTLGRERDVEVLKHNQPGDAVLQVWVL